MQYNKHIIIYIIMIFTNFIIYVNAYSASYEISAIDEYTNAPSNHIISSYKQNKEHKTDTDIEINENSVCIGCVTNNGGDQIVKRNIEIGNVTILNSNGETTIYHNGRKVIDDKLNNK